MNLLWIGHAMALLNKYARNRINDIFMFINGAYCIIDNSIYACPCSLGCLLTGNCIAEKNT
jgi:hypothetical protein